MRGGRLTQDLPRRHQHAPHRALYYAEPASEAGTVSRSQHTKGPAARGLHRGPPRSRSRPFSSHEMTRRCFSCEHGAGTHSRQPGPSTWPPAGQDGNTQLRRSHTASSALARGSQPHRAPPTGAVCAPRGAASEQCPDPCSPSAAWSPWPS